MRLTFCPEPLCGVPAEILHSSTVGSTEGPLEVVTTHCARRHVYVLLAESLTEDVYVEALPAGR
jgi:hypothetical protein